MDSDKVAVLWECAVSFGRQSQDSSSLSFSAFLDSGIRGRSLGRREVLRSPGKTVDINLSHQSSRSSCQSVCLKVNLLTDFLSGSSESVEGVASE